MRGKALRQAAAVRAQLRHCWPCCWCCWRCGSSQRALGAGDRPQLLAIDPELELPF